MTTRFRTNWRGKIILQVFERGITEFYDEETRRTSRVPWERWRDAKLRDFPGALSLPTP